jgi:hypothetical protein
MLSAYRVKHADLAVGVALDQLQFKRDVRTDAKGIDDTGGQL